MKNVLIDRHHAGLFHSLQLLGDRLDWQVFTPVGFEWWVEDYWTFGREAYGDARLRDQYLDTSDAAWLPLRGIGHWKTADPEFPDYEIRGITLEGAREWRWDYVMATVQDNQRGFHRFATEVGARYLYQVGNTGQQVDWSLDPICLVSSEVPIKGKGIRYHQEMDPVYHWREPEYDSSQAARIASFTNFATHYDCWPTDVELWKALQDFDWRLHGGGMPAGVLKPSALIAEAMSRAAWALHDKPTGDGFGHVLWGWAAVGRPLIGHASHYKGKLGEVLWEDMETCIDLDQHDPVVAAHLIRDITRDPDRHHHMCRAIRARFEAHYDPGRDAADIARLLGAI